MFGNLKKKIEDKKKELYLNEAQKYSAMIKSEKSLADKREYLSGLKKEYEKQKSRGRETTTGKSKAIGMAQAFFNNAAQVSIVGDNTPKKRTVKRKTQEKPRTFLGM